MKDYLHKERQWRIRVSAVEAPKRLAVCHEKCMDLISLSEGVQHLEHGMYYASIK